VTISHDHADHNNSDKVSGVKKIISNPGEYEIMGVSIIGLSSYHDDEKGEKRGKNTIYIYEAEGLRVAHLGDLGHELTDDLVDQMGAIDILMIPVGGDYTIGPKEASNIVSKIDPYFVIPMHYKVDGMTDTFSALQPLDAFLKEVGIPSETLPKLSIKKSEMQEDQNTKVIVLERK
jgi:L-ascorbate metabolism protein UlaG (beta-lactamase superfamily)